MFPNGYQIPFVPNYYQAPINAGLNGLRGATSMGAKGGLFSRLFGLKSVNWSGILNNTSKTLGVINQAVPLVKQVGPMFNNMKSMLKVASIFKDETDSTYSKNSNNDKKSNDSNVSSNEKTNIEKEKIRTNNNYPNFFI